MASRTQLRLGQVTGSFGDAEGKIVDNLATAASLAAIPAGSGSMVSVMSQFASSIKRINGGAAFSAVAASTLADAGATTRISYANGANTIVRGPNGDTEFTVTDSGVTVAAALDVDGTADFDVTDFDVASSGDIDLVSTANAEKAIFLHANGGINESIELRSQQGTGVNAKGASTDASISIHSDLGGIGLYSAINADNAITLEANGGANETIQVRSNQGTGVATADIANAVNASIALVSDVGGIGIASGLDATDAIRIEADGGTSETIVISANQGNTATSVTINSDDGGVSILAGSTSHGVKIATGTSGVPVTIGHSTSEVTIADNLTVTGDLTVSGDTVTIDTTNLSVEDRMILLHKGNTVKASNSNGTSAVAFLSGSNTTDQSTIFGAVDVDVLAAARMDATDGTATPDFTNLVALRASSIQLGAPEESISGDGTDITFALGANGDINIPTDIGLTFGNDGEKIEGNGSQLTIASRNNLTLDSAGDIILDADGGDIFFKDDSVTGDTFFQFTNLDTGGGGIASIVSSSLGDMIFATNQTAFTFVKGAINLGSPGNEDILEINHGTNKVELKLGNLSSSRVRLELDDTQSGGDYATEGCVSDLSGSLLLDNGHVAGEIRFQEAGTGNHYMGFRAPDEVTADKVFTLPDGHPASNDSAIVSSTAGVLSYATIPTTAKGVYAMTASHAATVAFKTTTNGNRVSASDQITLTDVTDSQGKNLDVFVNGQLLMSGSQAAVGNGTADYMLDDTTNIAFGFGLEIDDVVQIILRS